MGALTPFLEPSLSNDGDIAHGSFTSSLMPLHACSTQREREGGGEKRRREGEEARSEGGGRPALPASASLSLPSFLSRSLVYAVSLRYTHKHVFVCRFTSCCGLSPTLRLLLLRLFYPLLLHLLQPSLSLSRASSSPVVTQPGRK